MVGDFPHPSRQALGSTRMQAEALVSQPAYGYNTTPPQPNHNVTPTHIEPEQYNP